jgi:hypothetical protein
MLDIETWTPLATFAVAYGCAIVGGVGAMVKSAGEGGKPVTRRRVFEVFVYWGPLAIACPMLAWESPWIGKKPIIAIAVAILIALGVIKVADFARSLRRYLKLEDAPNDSDRQAGSNPDREA